MTGAGGASLDWDRRRRVTPVQTASQEAWPEAEPLGWNTPLGESRGGTPEGERALQGASRIARCGGCGPASFGVPLPFISSFLSWLAELDRDGSRIHRRRLLTKIRVLTFGFGNGFGKARAKIMRRENEIACTIRPRDSGGGGPLELAKRANRGGGGAGL